ncbi:MAG: hypothetical protein EU543_06355 [Promethearchaeota archaeon]|nr:MAG: hypothetical protein EU543_06355 [Candidatus Lokiarchaeota archaeon]
MDGIYKLYEPDFFTDLSALTSLAKRISGKRDIKIQYLNTSLIYTDGPFIYIPIKFKKNITYSQGFIAHESGHIGYGSFELSILNLVRVLSKKYDLPGNLVKRIVNIVEDVRIDMINKQRFPGFYYYLRKYTLEILPQLIKRMQLSGDILLYINLFMEDYHEFQMKPVFSTREMKNEDWETIKTIKKLLLKSLTPNTSIIVTDQFCKILKKYFRKKKVIMKPKGRSGAHNSISNNYNRNCRNRSDYVILDEESIDGNQREKEEFEISSLDEPNKLADPFYLEDEDLGRIGPINIQDNEEFLSQVENFSFREEKREKSNIDKSSEETVKELEKNDLKHEDLKELLNKIEIKEEENQENPTETEDFEKMIDNFSKKSQILDSFESKESDDHMEDLVELKDLEKDSEKITYIPIENEENSLDRSNAKKAIIDDILGLIEASDEEMKERFIRLETLTLKDEKNKKELSRKVIDTNIEDEKMNPIDLTYKEILSVHNNMVNKIKNIFSTLNNEKEYDAFQNIGRLNKGFIKAITSNYNYKQCFTRKLNRKILKILLMVDISGSMRGIKLEAAKIAMILLCEALKDIAFLRIVLFTGERDARNILVKDFNEQIQIKKLDLFGCHGYINSNLDGISIQYEASKLEGNEIIIVISDGQPAGTGYGLNDAIDEIQDVRKKFNVFAFSIDAEGEYLDKLYGKYWILAKSREKTDLGEKMIQFSRIIVKEYFI